MSNRNVAEISKRMQFGAIALGSAVDLVAADQFPEWQYEELADSLESLVQALRVEGAPVIEAELADQPKQAEKPGIVDGGSIS